MGFKEGELNDVLSGAKVGDSFYVRISFERPGSIVSRDAVLTVTNTSDAGIDSYTITSDGEVVYTQENDDILNSNTIKVYDVPEEEFGKASLDQLSEFSATSGSDQSKVRKGEEPVEKDKSVGNTGGSSAATNSYKFSIADIMKDGRITDPNILYEHIIEENNCSAFDSFQSKATSDSDKIITMLDEIDATLAATNSEAFYSGSTAKANVVKLTESNEHTKKAKTVFGSVDSSEVTATIKSFNDRLRQRRIETRRYLADQTAREITAAHEEDKSKKEYLETTYKEVYPKNVSYLEDNIYKVEIEYVANGLYNGETGEMGFDKWKHYYYHFEYSNAATAEDIEALLRKAGLIERLPYFPEKVVKD